MSRIDPDRGWLVLVETPDGGTCVARLPAETFDVEAVLDLRAQVGEKAGVSLIGDEYLACCESSSDLKAQVESWVEIALCDPEKGEGEAVDIAGQGDTTCISMWCSRATCSGCPFDEVTA